MNRVLCSAVRRLIQPLLCGATAVFASVASLHAAELVKAEGTTNDLGVAGAYTDALAVPTNADTLVFNSTLMSSSSFTWTGSARNVLAVRVVDPANALTINLSGATYNFINAAGAVIDLSSATKNLTLATASATAITSVRGTAADGAPITVASGRTLRIQTNLQYNNASTASTSTIKFSGGGNVTVDGTHGRVTDKNPGNGSLTALKHEGTGTLTLLNANTYSGGTTVSSGAVFVGATKALGDGAVTFTGGTLDLNGAGVVDLTVADNKDFTSTNATLKFNLGTSSDQISGGGTGKFSLTGGTIELTLGSGFSYGSTYTLFDGFVGGTSSVVNVDIQGFDADAYSAVLSTSGVLSFTGSTVPEPATYAAIAGIVVLGWGASRRRR